MKRAIFFGMLAIFVLALIIILSTACGNGATPVPAPISTATPTLVPTVSPIPPPTSTSVPTATPLPTPTKLPTATPVPAPTSTSVPPPTATSVPTPTATPLPTATPTPEPTIVSEDSSGSVEETGDREGQGEAHEYDPANVPDFYLEQSWILGLLETGGVANVLLVSWDEEQKHFIAEFVIYPSITFWKEIDFRRVNLEMEFEEVIKWRPSLEYIPYLAWSPLGDVEGDSVTMHFYERSEEGELTYIASDTIARHSLKADDTSLSKSLAYLFRKHIGKPE